MSALNIRVHVQAETSGRKLLPGRDDDLESFLWVILYICMRYLLTTLDSAMLSSILEENFRNDVQVLRAKGGVSKLKGGGNKRGTFSS